MSLERSGRQEDKVRAYLRAKLNLKQAYERIDWKHDVVHPIIDALKAGKPVLGLPEAMTLDNIELQITDEDSDPQPESDTIRAAAHSAPASRVQGTKKARAGLRHRK